MQGQVYAQRFMYIRRMKMSERDSKAICIWCGKVCSGGVMYEERLGLQRTRSGMHNKSCAIYIGARLFGLDRSAFEA